MNRFFNDLRFKSELFRLVPDKESGLTEVRFWHEDELLGIQKVKNNIDLNLVHF
jgi:hypothetical protein